MVDLGMRLPLHETQIFLDKSPGQIEWMQGRVVNLPLLAGGKIVEPTSASLVQFWKSAGEVLNKQGQGFGRTRVRFRQDGEDLSVSFGEESFFLFELDSALGIGLDPVFELKRHEPHREPKRSGLERRVVRWRRI